MHAPSPMHPSPRCGAKTRAGTPCRSPAVRGRARCRMHGGAAGSGGQPGNGNALRHGHYTAEAIAGRRRQHALLRWVPATLPDAKGALTIKPSRDLFGKPAKRGAKEPQNGP